MAKSKHGIKAYKLKNGDKRYLFKAYLGINPVTGKRVETTRRGFKTKEEAQLAMYRLKLDYKNGVYSNQHKVVTVDSLYHEWFASYKKTVKGSTANLLSRNYRLYIKPVFGSLDIKKITLSYIQNFVNEIAGKYAACHIMLVPLNMIYDLALKLGIVDRNLARLVTYPRKKRTKKKKNFYDRNQLNEFLKLAKKEENPLIYPCFRLLAFTGIRRGELAALQWKDVDFIRKILHITKTSTLDINGKRTIDAPKTKASIRDISLDNGTIKVLSNLYTQQGSKLSDYIFSPNPSKPIYYASVVWLEMIYRHNPDFPRITPHGFRHTHASLLFQSGASIKEVQYRLGHSDVNTTLGIYTHVMKEQSSQTGAKFAKFIEN